MKKYPLPIEIVKGRLPLVTQEFGNHSNDAWYANNGINLGETGHNGTDLIITGGWAATYGTRLVCPFPKALLNKVWYTEPMSTKGNGIQIQCNDERGVIKMLIWHCSETNEQMEYDEKDTLGFIGNSGLVSPKPYFANVHAGSHIHLMTYVNGVLVDPREIFDFNEWYVSETDTSIEKDLPPFFHFLSYVRKTLEEISGKISKRN